MQSSGFLLPWQLILKTKTVVLFTFFTLDVKGVWIPGDTPTELISHFSSKKVCFFTSKTYSLFRDEEH